MEITISINDRQVVAFNKALVAYNASNGPLLGPAFMQKMIDGVLDNFVRAYVTTQMDKTTWLKERFTQAERAAIRQAAMTNGEIADLCALVDGASIVHLDDPVTIGGVAALEAAGLLAPGRGAEILAM